CVGAAGRARGAAGAGSARLRLAARLAEVSTRISPAAERNSEGITHGLIPPVHCCFRLWSGAVSFKNLIGSRDLEILKSFLIDPALIPVTISPFCEHLLWADLCSEARARDQ